MVLGDNARDIGHQPIEEVVQLLHAPFAHGFEETALLDAALERDLLAGEIVLIQGLDKASSRGERFQMEVYERVELILECHLKRSVSS